VRIGATVVVDREVVAVGTNSDTKSHPLQKQYNEKYRNFVGACHHLRHAEFDALIKAKATFKDLTGAKIYIYREQKDGEIGMSRPCPSCMHFISDMHISDIYYTSDTGLCYEEVEHG